MGNDKHWIFKCNWYSRAYLVINIHIRLQSLLYYICSEQFLKSGDSDNFISWGLTYVILIVSILIIDLINAIVLNLFNDIKCINVI